MTNPSPDEGLMPCPWCGNEAVEITHTDFYWAVCQDDDCQAEGPLRRTEIEAISAWNTRISAPQPEPTEIVERIAKDAAWDAVQGMDVAMCPEESDEIALAILTTLTALRPVAGNGAELERMCARIEADAVAGLRYIEQHYGRLEGVGWDRVFNAHDELFRLAGERDTALAAHTSGGSGE